MKPAAILKISEGSGKVGEPGAWFAMVMIPPIGCGALGSISIGASGDNPSFVGRDVDAPQKSGMVGVDARRVY
jgi:hypothetical protein